MTGLIQSKGGGGERCTEIRTIEVPDLWHIAMRSCDLGNTEDEKRILECWHLAHDMKNALQHIDKVLPVMLGYATSRLHEYITDIQEMGDIEQRTVDNLGMWAEDLKSIVSVFEYLPMDEDFMAQARNDAKLYIKEALELREEIKQEIDPEYTSNYDCTCGHQWTRTWTVACNDKCPKCNLEIEPTVSAERYS